MSVWADKGLEQPVSISSQPVIIQSDSCCWVKMSVYPVAIVIFGTSKL